MVRGLQCFMQNWEDGPDWLFVSEAGVHAHIPSWETKRENVDLNAHGSQAASCHFAFALKYVSAA